MAEQSTRSADEPTSEVLPTVGLVMLLGAVMGSVGALVALSQGNASLAGVLGAVVALSFVVSLVCFFSDSNRVADTPLPFPSWFRTAADGATELSPAR